MPFTFSFPEVVDLVVMTAFLGFIFMDMFRRQAHMDIDPLLVSKPMFDWHAFWFACLVIAPGIVLHEIGHKIVALSFGQIAVFHAAYNFLILGLILKLVNFPFIFFVSGYVSHMGSAGPLQLSIIALAGPLVNFLLWGLATIMLKQKKVKKKQLAFWLITQKVNLFLFIFNMLPIPPFDGFTVFSGLYHAFF